jgi:7,8-dihydropterin-6-yl-methyl-4-(beta-D-ribofuranosyl)aminobenzene 5'-phosphate synthase
LDKRQFLSVESLTEVATGIYLIPMVSQTPGTLELRELSLAIKTRKGLILTTGCSHPGIEKILEAATAVDNYVHLIFGGLHLVTTPDVEIERITSGLLEKWKVDLIALGHCTGEPAFAALQKHLANDISMPVGNIFKTAMSHLVAQAS